LRQRLLNEGIADERQLGSLDVKARALVDRAIAFARESALPAPEAALDCMFAS
jgi:pyruvate dehydrogenase E1 component alpha subunit